MGEGLAGYTVDGLTVGRIVHYVAPGGQHLAAVVTQVHARLHPGLVDLTVFYPSGDPPFMFTEVPGDQETQGPGTWHWIEHIP